jgi:hypothetical protein
MMREEPASEIKLEDYNNMNKRLSDIDAKLNKLDNKIDNLLKDAVKQKKY